MFWSSSSSLILATWWLRNQNTSVVRQQLFLATKKICIHFTFQPCWTILPHSIKYFFCSHFAFCSHFVSLASARQLQTTTGPFPASGENLEKMWLSLLTSWQDDTPHSRIFARPRWGWRCQHISGPSLTTTRNFTYQSSVLSGPLFPPSIF